MKPNIFEQITKKASKTFYAATLLFPKGVRDDVFILYSFLRTADDLIDANPPKIKEFALFKKMTYKRLSGKNVTNIIINTFGKLVERKKIDHQLITDFFNSLEIDLHKSSYKNFEELLTFTYGVAEVVGLLMAQVMNLPKKSYTSARKLGLAMQLVNILRDIDEDRILKRVYIPQQELKQFKLKKIITNTHAIDEEIAFKKLMSLQINRIFTIFDDAKKGFKYIPREYLIAIMSATDIYCHIAKKINDNPFIIFKKKVRPSRLFTTYTIVKNLIKHNVRY